MLKNMQEVLEYGFEKINERYFESALPPIVITIMSSHDYYLRETVVYTVSLFSADEVTVTAFFTAFEQ